MNKPTDIYLTSKNISENIVINSVIAVISSEDADIGENQTYKFISGDGDDNNDQFSVEANLLKINFSPDYEKKSIYKIRLKTTDASDLSFEKAFTLNIKNVNEKPSAINLSSSSFDEYISVNDIIIRHAIAKD